MKTLTIILLILAIQGLYFPKPAFSNRATTTVTCPSPFSLEVSSGLYNLSGADPAGGTYSGPGVAAGEAVFNPALAGLGAHTIHYTWVDPATGAPAFCTFVITVFEEEKAPAAPAALNASTLSKTEIALSWTDHADNEDGFVVERRPGLAGQWETIATLGPNTTAYQDTGLEAGSRYSYQLLAFNEAGQSGYSNVATATTQMTCPGPEVACQDGFVIALGGGDPPGGLFSGTGVSYSNIHVAYIFDPSGLSAGTYSIQYTIPSSGASCNFMVTVLPGPDVSLAPFAAVCQNSTPFQLTGAAPAGGQYSGPGVADGSFDPAAAGPGSHEVSYTYTDPSTGCSNMAVSVITVLPTPEVSIPVYEAICAGHPPLALTGATPTGGMYSGTGVADGSFDPAAAGPGSHEITYSYSNPESGCAATATTMISVVASPEVSCPDDTLSVSIDTTAFDLDGAIPPGGVYNGPGVDNGAFDPAAAGPGSHTITYTYSDPATGCSASCRFVIVVTLDVAIHCPEDLTVCYADADIVLSGGMPAGGSYNGPGVMYDDDAQIFLFSATTAGPGNHTVTYIVVVAGAEITCQFSVTVLPHPNISLPTYELVCVDAEPFMLAGATPEGGVFNGPGVADGLFDPSMAGPGSHEMSYTYTDPATGCSHQANLTITVTANPEVSCPDDLQFDVSDDPVSLNGGSPPGGIFVGPGITNGLFSPAAAGIGSHLVEYSFTDPASGCTSRCSFTIEVMEQVDMACPDDITMCIDWEFVTLQGAEPAGGTYAGEGVSTDQNSGAFIFSPPTTGAGTYQVVYTIETAYGIHSCTFSVVVDNCASAGSPEHGSLLGVFPNPATDHIRLVVEPRGQQPGQVMVFDTRGKLVAMATIAPQTGHLTMSVSHLPAGSYFIQLHRKETATLTRKFIIAR